MRVCAIRIALQRTRMHTRVRTHTCVRTHVRSVYVRVRLCGRKRVRKRVCACAACVRSQIHPLAYIYVSRHLLALRKYTILPHRA